MREVQWDATAVGPVTTWPASLKSIVAMMLYARQPMFLWWGPELIQFYNDGYVPSFGVGRHPSAMGQRGRECWAEIWPVIGPEIEGVIAQREATFHEDALVPIFRNGRMEEVYWTYGYSPVFEADGSVAGVLVVVTETTSRVVAQRRLRTARDLADVIGGATTAEALGRAALQAVAAAPEDAPWALVHRPHGSPDSSLITTDNLDAATAQAVVARVASEPIRSDFEASEPRLIDLSSILGLPGAPWPEPSQHALVIPLDGGAAKEPYGRMVIGLSARLPYDAAYQDHIRGLAGQLTSAVQRIDSLGARVAAEGARNDLLMQAPVAAALLVGPTWRFELANPLYEELVGRHVVGRNWHDCFPELHGSVVEGILTGVYEQGRTFFASEQHIPLVSNGVAEDRFFDFNMIPMRSDTGAIDGMMVVALDMTAQVRARRQLESSAVELKRLSEAKDQFVAMLGHELRNPLAPIATALRVMELRGVSGLERELAVIDRQVNHLTRLVDDLLDVSRIASGKVELDLTVLEISDVIARAIEVTSPIIEQRHQRLVVNVPRSGLRVRADIGRMTQVIANLLTNACKYGEAHGEIHVIAELRGGHVAVRVVDSGIGIDPEMLPLVFDLFSQERQSIDRARGGLGLGLAIVKNLMSMHGGSVDARSEGRGKGSTFTVTLPLIDAQAKPSDAAAPSVPPPASQTRKVLIVDDNRDSAEMLAEALRMLGHVVELAEDGPKALALVSHFAFDVALLDIGLPAMDGYELARHLRAQPATARAQLFALTGYGQEDDVRKALEAGFDAHFVKPVNFMAIVDAIGST
jgi:signal transduction histidine kinase